MLSLIEQVEANIRQQALLRPGQRVLVAVSGGLDSVVLLEVLYRLAEEFGWRLAVAHLNHGLRGASSNADERLVRRMADRLKLPVFAAKADVRSAARKSGISLEMAGRELRHLFLARAALRRKIPSIALAHHLDDQVELFFLRLVRGSGSQALAGMKWTNPSPVCGEVTLVRPLLNVAKTELLEFARSQNIDYREDATNRSLDIQRNRIRHELLPLLRRHYQPALTRSIVRVMDILGAESDWVTSTAESWLLRQRARLEDAKSGRNSGTFADLAVAVQRRCLQLELLRLGVIPEYDLVEHLRKCPESPIDISPTLRAGGTDLRKGPGVLTAKGNALRLMRVGAEVVRLKNDRRPEAFLSRSAIQLRVHKAGQRRWRGVKINWRIQSEAGQKLPPKVNGMEVFDADKVGGLVKVRHWRAGDRFQPSGMGQASKLQDLFVNQKVPRGTRHQLLVAATSSGELFWVEGLRIAERFKLTNSTIRRLQWRWQRL